MKRAFFTLAVLLQCLVFSSPMLAAARFDTNPNAISRQESFTFKKQNNRSLIKQAWQTVFQKKQLRQKPVSREGKLNFGWKALIAGLIATVALFTLGFEVLAIIASVACIVLGVIGLFKDESKAAAIIALALVLLLPIGWLIAFSLSCCGE